MLEVLVITIVLAWGLFLLLLTLRKPEKFTNMGGENEPMVTILIALRNEENNIPALCQSLTQLSYPSSRFEVLFGDDASTDNTLQQLAKHLPSNARIYSFLESDTGHFGKQKVLAQMSQQAKGSYLLFTDADMTFPKDWIQGLLGLASDPDHLMVGLTKVSGQGWFARMQNLDWLINEEIVSWFADRDIGLTAWGNNLLIQKDKYISIGGYGSLSETIVEDVALLHRVVDHRGRLIVNRSPEAVATTQPAKDIKSLLHQRKRWMQGIKRSKLLLVLGFGLKIMFWPAILYLATIELGWLSLAGLAMTSKFIALRRLAKLTGSCFNLAHLLLFEIYDFVFYLITFAFYCLPVKITWKGRDY